jgi:hypothetical protein
MDTVEKIVGSDIVLLWLDEHICQDDNCTDLKEEFERNTNTNIYLFHEVERCRRFLQTIRNKQAYCIIQGQHAEKIVPAIIQYTKSPVVYIFCLHTFPLSEWAQDYPCILKGGIFDHEQDLLARLTSDLADHALLKAQEYRVKRAACDDWAHNLTENAKRLKNEQCNLTFRTDPFSNQDTAGQQPGERNLSCN